MSEPDNFLSRWSRRKRAAAEQKAEPDQTGTVDEPAAQAAEEAGPAKPVATRPPELRAPAPAEPAFDVSSLPPIDSIVADTDISAFLKPGVPSALRHAALRRAWTTDPAIRDFKGLAENDWDFNDPDAIPGFGKLDADFDVRKLVAQVFGEKTSDAAPAESAAPAASLAAVRAGAAAVRVHDVAETKQALAVDAAIGQAGA